MDLKPDDYFWVPDEKEGYLLLRCGPKGFKKGQDQVECYHIDEGKSKIILTSAQTNQAELTDPSSIIAIDDMVKLGDLKEASILHNLRERFKVNDIYTKIGTILVSVNPFKLVNLYSPDILEAYALAGDQKDESGNVLPPHIFQLADQAYRNVVSLQESQSCLVSGESGAGKTEATKILLQFLTEMSARTASEDWGEQGRLQEQILKANPLMEAFGNAKTVRNNNSSRFGKYIEIKLNAHLGTIVGGSVTQYLLEKSRITSQSLNERNYHIFYQICAGAKADEEFKKKYRLHDPDTYRYLVDLTASENINDERGWEETTTAMTTLSMSGGEKDDLIRTVAAVLTLGNVEFAEKKEANYTGCQVSSMRVVELVAHQLGIDPLALSKAMCEKEVKTPNQASVYTQYSVQQAEAVRDSLARAVYGNLFDWLIKRINWALLAASKSAIQGQKMAHNAGGNVKEDFDVTKMNEDMALFSGQPVASIGVLDIFGFESFQTNSFEQLCINYCNEKLQGYFTEHIFKLEQSEYVKEGLSMSTITFKDNTEIIEMLERKRTGLFAMIDEEISVPRGSDDSLLNKIVKTFTGHVNFKQNMKDKAVKFGVLHFAGEVQYTISGFLDKNKDTLPNDVAVLLQASTHRFIRAMFPTMEAAAASNPKKSAIQMTTVAGGNKRSLIAQFKEQLASLMQTLSSTTPHFIRCVKPNKVLKGNVFDGTMVLEQLRYAGLLEVCKIRKQGFPTRRAHDYFIWRFGLLLGKGAEAQKGKQSASTLCQALSKKEMLTEKDWVCGKTKIFLKSEAFDRLERYRAGAVDSCAVTIQAMVRGKIVRTEMKQARNLLKEITSATASRDVQKIESLLLNCGILPNQGRHLPQIKAAKKVMQQVEEERRVEKLLVEAIVLEEADSLASALQAASSLKYNSPSVAAGEKLLGELKNYRKLLSQLDSAVQAREIEPLKVALKAVESSSRFREGDSSVHRARALVQRLVEEGTATAKLKAAISSGKVDVIKTAIDEMVAMGMGSHPLVADGLKITKETSAAVSKFEKFLKELRAQAAEAIQEKDFTKLDNIQTSCLEMGISKGKEPVIDQALALLADLMKARGFAGALLGARKALTLKSSRAAGIESEADLQGLKDAIAEAKKGGVTDDDSELVQAMDALARAQRQIQAQKSLLALISDPVASKDYAKVKQGLEQCEGLEMTTVDVFMRVKERLLQIEADRKAKPADMQYTRMDDIVDEDELERRNAEKLKSAMSPGYNFANYFRLRSDADFARGIMFNKSKPIHLKLAYQNEPLHKSLIEFPIEQSRQAVRLNRSILGYCGDVVMSFPASLAQDLVDKCLINPEMCDEVYIQMMKHITGNPQPQSVGRAWQLICIAVGAFPPSTDFEPYLLNFLLRFKTNKGIIGQYARYALRRLQSTISFGPTEETVSVDEILAYGDRPPVMATILLVDGTPITTDFPIPPHMNVDDVLRVCAEFLSLSDERAELFGMFVKESESKRKKTETENVDAYFVQPVGMKDGSMPMPDGLQEDLPPPPPPEDYDDEDIPPRTAFPLESTSYLGDVVLSMARTSKVETFQFKRKFFLPNQDKHSGSDKVYNRLMYLQVLEEVISGNWHVVEFETVCELCSISFAVDLGDEMPDSIEGIIEEGIMEYVPMNWREKKSEEDWAGVVLGKRKEMLNLSVEDLESSFVKICSEVLPTYGSCVFFGRKQAHGADFVVFIDYQGLRMMTLKTRETLVNIPYKNMKKFNGTSRVLTVELTNDPTPFVLFTSQAKEISALMHDYTVLLSLVPEDPNVRKIKQDLHSFEKRISRKPATNPNDKSVRKTMDILPPPSSTTSQVTTKPPMKPTVPNHTLQASSKVLAPSFKTNFKTWTSS